MALTPQQQGYEKALTYSRVIKTKGVKPYVKPNKYYMVNAHEDNGRNTISNQGRKVGDVNIYVNLSAEFGEVKRSTNTTSTLVRNNFYAGVHNRALTKLDDKLTISSNFFESWYERREVYKMVGAVGQEILDFVKNFRKPKYWAKKGKGIKPSSLPEAWLTYQFGIVPLIGTLDTAMKGLGLPLESLSFKSQARAPFEDKYTNTYSRAEIWYTGTYGKTLGCTVTPNPNPNVALLNLGGFTTPLSTAWSVIPWGWAIDYFVNVSDLLSNLEMKHPGVRTSNWYQTEMWDLSFQGLHKNSGSTAIMNPIVCLRSGKIICVERKLLTSAPKFKLHLDLPLLGTNKFANLFSAVALTMKGK